MNSIFARLFNAVLSGCRATYTWVRGPGGGIVGFAILGIGAIGLIIGFSVMNKDQTAQTPDVIEGQFFEIATGSVTGTYYPLGNAIASVISYPAGSVRCVDETRCGPAGLLAVVQAAQGSVANIEGIHSGRTDSGFAQANVVNQAYRGEGPFDTTYEDLRAISGLYGEAIHLVVALGSDIKSVADLAGRRVSVDRPGSGTSGIARRILQAEGISSRNAEFVEASADQSAELLISGEIDAFFYVAGPPVRAVQALANLKLMQLVPLTGPAIEALVEAEPYLTATEIAADTYLDTPAVQTVGVAALWIVHEDTDSELIYRITRALWNPENRHLLDGGPEQAGLMHLQGALDGVPIPFHPGASRFYREVGLFPSDANEPSETEPVE